MPLNGPLLSQVVDPMCNAAICVNERPVVPHMFQTPPFILPAQVMWQQAWDMSEEGEVLGMGWQEAAWRQWVVESISKAESDAPALRFPFPSLNIQLHGWCGSEEIHREPEGLPRSK